MSAFVFPGQGSQFPGMGKDLYDRFEEAKKLFHSANEILGFAISKILFEGSKEDLQATRVTQPAIFLHAVILSKVMGESFQPKAVAGHSLGEFSALTSIGVFSFEEGLRLVSKRAEAMQKACDETPGTMAAVLGLEDDKVAAICKETPGIVVPANYNCPGQLVISGEKTAVETACEKLKAAGARRALLLPVGGAFHSPLMESARAELEEAINEASFNMPQCAIYQNVSPVKITNIEAIKSNLITQLTAPVRWTQSIEQMCQDGFTHFTEVGPGKVLQGLIHKISSETETFKAAV